VGEQKFFSAKQRPDLEAPAATLIFFALYYLKLFRPHKSPMAKAGLAGSARHLVPQANEMNTEVSSISAHSGPILRTHLWWWPSWRGILPSSSRAFAPTIELVSPRTAYPRRYAQVLLKEPRVLAICLPGKIQNVTGQGYRAQHEVHPDIGEHPRKQDG
jgi:hypothetical protein